ncbi:hypothetical protein OC861_001521 [Tilletia horrida]|nr:hypothetical protein OC861_001521 [Tilletia horrida]
MSRSTTSLIIAFPRRDFVLQYKTFDFFDIVANMLGSALGLFLAYHAERRYRTRRELERLYQPLDADDEDAFAMDLEYGIGEDEDDDDDDDDDEDERSKRAFGGGSLSSKEDSKDRSSSDGDAQRTSQDNSVPKASGGHGTSSS